MYKIIGADGREYGPVTIEEVRRWIAEGRANAQTRVQPEGSTEWKTLGELPEFQPPPPAPPPLGTVNADQLAAEILAHDYNVRIGDCISRGWELVKNNFWLLVGASFLIHLIVGAVGIIGGPLLGGLSWLFLKRIRGEPAQLGDAFAGFNRSFLGLFLAYLLIALLGALGLCLCVIPGVYLIVSWIFALPLIIDKKLDFWPAMELSRKIVSRHWWTVLGLVLVAGLVKLAGVLACFIGIFVTTPIAAAAMMYAYEDIFGNRPTAAG